MRTKGFGTRERDGAFISSSRLGVEFAEVSERVLDDVNPKQAAHVLHMEWLDHPQNAGTGHRRILALCGQYLRSHEMAAHADYVTCPRCKARMDAIEQVNV